MIKPCRCGLCNSFFMKSYEEDTAPMLNKYILGNYYIYILVSFWRKINHLNAVHVTEFSKSVRLEPSKCRLCDSFFMSSYEEDTISMQMEYILGNYYTHKSVGLNHLKAVYVTEFS